MTTAAKFEKAQRLVAGNKTIKDACDKVGMALGTYYAYRARAMKKPEPKTAKVATKKGLTEISFNLGQVKIILCGPEHEVFKAAIFLLGRTGVL